MEGNLSAFGVQSSIIDMGSGSELPTKIRTMVCDIEKQMTDAGFANVRVFVDPPDPSDPALTEAIFRDTHRAPIEGKGH